MGNVSRRVFLANAVGSTVLSAAVPPALSAAEKGSPQQIAAAQPSPQPEQKPTDEICGLRVVAPSTLAVNQEFSLGIKVLGDRRVVARQWPGTPPALGSSCSVSPRGLLYMDNVPGKWEGTVQIRADGGFRGPDGYTFHNYRGPGGKDGRPIIRLSGFRFSEPGIKRIEIVDPVSGVRSVSNPIEVSAGPPAEHLYWGDLHCHTLLSDGLRSPEEVYAFARREAFLDIFALSDHSEYRTNRQWDYFTAVTNDSNDPGAFVTLVGLEWTSPKFGHRNLYYPGDRGPCVRHNDPEEGKLPRLYEIARREGALVIPHHTANVSLGLNWAMGHDPEVERLVEIYSVWGNSERPASAGNPRPIRSNGGEKAGRHVLDALARGYRLGIIAGGDVHDGRPGDELMRFQPFRNDFAEFKPNENYPKLWPQGIMGVWARELTRQAVFEALWNRRVFATTNVRTLLRFSVCGRPMGSIVRHAGARPIKVSVSGQSPIARIEIVRNGETIKTHQPPSSDAGYECEDAGTGGTDWYYARVIHTDGEMAWSSPVWVET